MAMSPSSMLEQLATYRTKNTRASRDIFDKGCVILKAQTKLGDDGWDFFEQLALASIDVGKFDIADVCLEQLAKKFPRSPHVDALTGIRMEATEAPSVVLQYYDELLEADSSNVAIWKRRISVIRRLGHINKAVDELVRFLDTFYTDVEGWLELADIYSLCNKYLSALQSLSHALILSPQNPFTVLQFAETAYTSKDVPLALKMSLLVTDMCERDIDNASELSPKGINARAWWVVKLCSRTLMNSPSAPSHSSTPVAKNLAAIDEIATVRVLAIYQGRSMSSLVSKWMSISV